MATTPIDDTLNKQDFENQFDGQDPDDSDLPGSTDSVVEQEAIRARVAAAPQDAEFDPEKLAAAPAAAPVAAPAPAAAAPAADDGAAAPAPAPAPTVDADLADPRYQPVELRMPEPTAPANAEALIESARATLDKAMEDLNDGTISPAEYNAQRRASEAIIEQTKDAITLDRVRAESVNDRLNTLYAEKQNATLAQMKAAGIPTDKDTIAQFTDIVAMYGRRAEAKGLADGANLAASQWALDKAAADMAKLHGVAVAPAKAPAAPAAPKAKTEAEARAERRVDPTKIPPTLAGVPVAQESTIEGNRFAHLDGLEGGALEKAIAVMTQADQDAYLGGM